jgi:ribokinase
MPRVVVVGSSNTDMTVRMPRLPAPGQTILGTTFSTTPGGKGANQAVAARRAGAEVVFVTAVGDDDLGKEALKLYEREGIDVRHVRIVEGARSGVALIYVSEDGENMIGVAPGANQELLPDDIDQLPASVFHHDNVLLVSLEVPVPTAIRALRRGFDAGMLTILNPAPAPALARAEVEELFEGVMLITPNRLEALTLAGMKPAWETEPDWREISCHLKQLGPTVVLITLGSNGSQVFHAKPWPIVPSLRVQAVDTVGAGDAFNGALAAALAESWGTPAWPGFRREVVVWANAAGALAVTQAGAQASLPFRDDIDRLARQAHECGMKDE